MALDAQQQTGYRAIVDAAAQNGLTKLETVYALATSWVESTFRPQAVGDGGTSFGLFQHHVGGAGGATLASAQRYSNASVSAAERIPWFGRRDIDTGAEAAALQRPADPSKYARDVAAAARTISGGKLPDGTPLAAAYGGAAAPSAATGKKGTVTGDLDGLNGQLLLALQLLAGDIGKTINVVSGYRSRAEQAALYQKYLNGTGNLAAKPGQSNHESGNAADAYVNGVALQTAAGAAAAKYGLGFPVKGEAWHVELVGGLSSVNFDLTPWDGIVPDVPGIELGDGDVVPGSPGKAIGEAVEWAGEHLFATVIIAVGLLLGAALITVGGLQAFGGSGGSAVNVATTVNPAARAAKAAKGGAS